MIDLTGIISITGQPGLFKILAQAKNGIIVEGLADKKRVHVYSSTKVSTLADIGMYTTGDEKPIEEIMTAIYEKEKGGAAVSAKADDKEVEAYFAQILPEYDKERVYISNMRKLFSWYGILQSTGNLKLKEENKEENKTVKTEDKAKAPAKTSLKDTAKNVKTSAGVKKTAGVRKTGTA
ncbi:MAG: DUF5606 family protein [Bacteroidia bacterium]